MAKRAVLAVVWVAFIADLFVGAGFIVSGKPTLRVIGLAMIGGLALLLGALTLWFYMQNRRKARS